ncbi:heme/hemin ABC transporter substrate-binding protein [Consotaella aegiceratis]|uniref:heme/hemin ABC transporter substrate-binding protein n=1 Tax=Consotaella aegiceratis TaxID=3097961 RepID=UPI002F408920
MHRTTSTILPLIASLALALSIASPVRAETITDAAGRTVEIADRSRIVSIGSPVTEILWALGLQSKIVGVDTTSIYPPAAEDMPDVGYMRQLTAEGVLSLKPTLVLAVDGSGPQDVIDVLEQAAVPFVIIPNEPTGQGVLAKIRAVADAAGEIDKGEDLARSVEADLATVEAAVSKIQDRRKVAFVMSMQSGAPLVAGSHTSAEGMFELAGAVNAFSDIEGFKPATPEAVVTAAPEAIVTMTTGPHETTKAALAASAFATTPAVASGRISNFDGVYLLGFGPRVANAARDLAKAIYPDTDWPDLPPHPWTK